MPTDTIGAGWSFPLEVSAPGSFAVAAGLSKLEQSMRLILLTYPGERPMRGDFGSRLRDYVFQPPTPGMLADLAAEVRAALGRWEPRAVVEQVRVEPDPDDRGLLLIEIDYTVQATGERTTAVMGFHHLPGEGED